MISSKARSLLLAACMVLSLGSCTYCSANEANAAISETGVTQEQLKAMTQYSENKRITDGNYDKALAVKCVNGTFVGKKTENIISYKGIPFVGRQPVGELRWKAPADVAPNDGIYEAYYFGKFSKTMRRMWVQFAKTGNPSLPASLSPDGKAKEWPLYDLEDKKVMVLDEFDIHPAKESEVHIVDWDRTYFLSKYYML